MINVIVCIFVAVERPMFRSYEPQDDTLKEAQLPKAKPSEG